MAQLGVGDDGTATDMDTDTDTGTEGRKHTNHQSPPPIASLRNRSCHSPCALIASSAAVRSATGEPVLNLRITAGGCQHGTQTHPRGNTPSLLVIANPMREEMNGRVSFMAVCDGRVGDDECACGTTPGQRRVGGEALVGVCSRGMTS